MLAQAWGSPCCECERTPPRAWVSGRSTALLRTRWVGPLKVCEELTRGHRSGDADGWRQKDQIRGRDEEGRLETL